jgi:CDP-diacylglycerol--glycerol-3-phosphate 3-phosphatidyltransferase
VGLDAPSLEKAAMNIMNIPNYLSISRVLAVPVFIILMMDPTPVRAVIAGAVFAIASATDWLDGYLARKWGQITRIGKLLDPIADKILISSALILLVELDSSKVPSWIAIILIGREIAVTGLRAMAASDGVIIPAETLGKYKVGAQITAVLSFVLNYAIREQWADDLGRAALWSAMVLSLYSGLQYFMNYWKRLA